MNLDELYTAVSARITQEVVNHRTLDWPSYFSQLRETIRRVANDPTNGELSVDERIHLTRRLLAHVDELERAWPNLNPQ
jgi:hypothetical protein